MHKLKPSALRFSAFASEPAHLHLICSQCRVARVPDSESSPALSIQSV